MIMRRIDGKDTWDRFVDESPDGLLFHRWDLLKIVEKYTGYRLYTYGIYRNDRLFGVIPFFLRVRGGLRMMLSPPPTRKANLPYLGFAMSPEFWRLNHHGRIRAMARIIEGMQRGLRDISPNDISIGLNSTIVDVRPFAWNGYEIDQQYTYILDLERPLDEIWEGFDRDCRKNIIECSRHPLRMERTNDVDTFNEIMKTNLAKEGETLYHRWDPAYVRELLAAFPDNIKLYFFYDGEEIIGVKLNAGYKEHYVSWMGNVALGKNRSANEYFYWEMIKMAKSEGYKRHENYGATSPRLNLFKAKFNPALEPCFYVEKKDGLYRAVEYGYRCASRLPRAVE